MIDKRLFVPIIALVFLYAIGMWAYHNVEGWGWTDCAYFLTVTFTTIGYGDISPKTHIGKLMTIMFCWSGVAVALYTFSVIASIMQQHDESNLEKITKQLDNVTRLMPKGDIK